MSDWRSYDNVAETYERVHAPRFAEVARDLASLAGAGPGARVLDVGTGTGVAAEAAGERFTGADSFDEALRDAGLTRVRIERREFRFRYGLDEYFDGLATFTIGRFLRDMLGEEGWASFVVRARQAFAERFSDPLHDFRQAHLAAGT